MSHKLSFIKRINCPMCQESYKLRSVFGISFSAPVIKNFLYSYYQTHIDIDDAIYHIKECLKCRLMWQEEILNNDSMNYLYDELISSDDSLKKRINYPQKFYRDLSREVKFNYSLIGKKPSDIKILDFGMGWGHWANMSKAFGGQVFVAEISAKRKMMAKDMGLSLFDFDQDDVKFDFVNLDQVLEHLGNPGDVVKKLHSAINQNGILKITVPNGRNQIQNLSEKNWVPKKDSLHPLEHINSFSPTSLISSISLLGFKPINLIDIYKVSFSNSFIYICKKIFNQYFSTRIYFKKV